jgi:hypothetical protein
MLPAATYAAVVIPAETQHGTFACQWGRSKEKGTLQVVVGFEILRGPHAGETISWIGYMTDKTSERTLKALRTCGFTGDDIDAFHAQRPENEVSIVVEHETYDGKARAKVQWINPPGGNVLVTPPLEASEMRKLSAQLKATLKGYPSITTKKAEREPPSADTAPAPSSDAWSGNDEPDPPKPGSGFGGSTGTQVSDDDIPF